jgi:dolichyl-phosphate-mannose--protein O-mannosyl transferase
MIATDTFQRIEWRRLRLSKREWLRLLVAGTAWGMAVSVGLTGLSLWNDGVLCIPELLATAAMAIPAGLLTIGPVAVYARR